MSCRPPRVRLALQSEVAFRSNATVTWCSRVVNRNFPSSCCFPNTRQPFGPPPRSCARSGLGSPVFSLARPSSGTSGLRRRSPVLFDVSPYYAAVRLLRVHAVLELSPSPAGPHFAARRRQVSRFSPEVSIVLWSSTPRDAAARVWRRCRCLPAVYTVGSRNDNFGVNTRRHMPCERFKYPLRWPHIIGVRMVRYPFLCDSFIRYFMSVIPTLTRHTKRCLRTNQSVSSQFG